MLIWPPVLTIQESSFYTFAAEVNITILMRILNVTLSWLILVELLDN
jgi:hypothetical protein